jgi:hypothetical protein
MSAFRWRSPHQSQQLRLRQVHAVAVLHRLLQRSDDLLGEPLIIDLSPPGKTSLGQVGITRTCGARYYRHERIFNRNQFQLAYGLKSRLFILILIG